MAKLKPAAKFSLIFVIAGIVFGGLFIAKNSGALDSIAPKGNEAGSGDVPKGMFSGSSKKDVVTFGVVTWGGYAPGEYYNESFDANEKSRFFKDAGVKVEFKIMDVQQNSRSAFKSDAVQILWATADALPTEMGGLQQYDPVVLWQADWSQGGDAFVVSSGINSANDLIGKKVAFAEATPSHTFLLYALDAGDLNYSDINPVVVSDAIEAAKLFRDGKVDAAVVWAPDDEDCVAKRAGAKILMSTKDAPNIIADVFIAKRAWVNQNKDKVQAIIRGWMIAAAELNSSESAKKKAARILSEGFGKDFDEAFAYNSMTKARHTNFNDNMQFFGLDPSYTGMTGEKLYSRMTKIYRMINMVRGDIPSWDKIADPSFLENLKGELGEDSRHAAQAKQTYSAPTASMAKEEAVSTKKVRIHFETGSSTLSENAKTIIDFKFGDIVLMSANRIRIEGNTDNTGSRSTNVSLSKKRASSVGNYLIEKYNVDRNRLVIVGNGPDKPVASNENPKGRQKNRRTDFALLSN